MIKKVTIKQRRPKRVARIRAILNGTSARPRLVLFRSHTTLYGQFIDDEKRKILGAVRQRGTNITSGSALGTSAASFCKKKGIKQLVFDRSGYKYHGVIRQIADTIRREGVII